MATRTKEYRGDSPLSALDPLGPFPAIQVEPDRLAVELEAGATATELLTVGNPARRT